MMLPIDSTPEQWRAAVKRHAQELRKKVEGTKLFGKDFKNTDMDAVLVAVFLMGVHDTKDTVEKLMAHLDNPYKYVDEVIKKHNPQRAKVIKQINETQ